MMVEMVWGSIVEKYPKLLSGGGEGKGWEVRGLGFRV